MEGIKIVDHGGMKCDNPNCDWEDANLYYRDVAVGAPCPKCGESILTQEDFDSANKLEKAVEAFEGLTEERVAYLQEKISQDPESLTLEELQDIVDVSEVLMPLIEALPSDMKEGTVSFSAEAHKGINIKNIKWNPKKEDDEHSN